MHYDSPVGDILLAEKDAALIGLWMEGQTCSLRRYGEKIAETDSDTVLLQTKCWLDRYFAGQKPCIDALRLAPAGSDFRQAVWNILCTIPYGQVITYGEIAKKIAAQRGIEKIAARAVGGAVSHNPISIIIPCHRVIGVHGNLTGYNGGIDKKVKLLALEGVDLRRYTVPAK